MNEEQNEAQATEQDTFVTIKTLENELIDLKNENKSLKHRILELDAVPKTLLKSDNELRNEILDEIANAVKHFTYYDQSGKTATQVILALKS